MKKECRQRCIAYNSFNLTISTKRLRWCCNQLQEINFSNEEYCNECKLIRGTYWTTNYRDISNKVPYSITISPKSEIKIMNLVLKLTVRICRQHHNLMLWQHCFIDHRQNCKGQQYFRENEGKSQGLTRDKPLDKTEVILSSSFHYTTLQMWMLDHLQKACNSNESGSHNML